MDFSKYLDRYKEDMLTTLKDSLAFRSVVEQPFKAKDGSIYPFGVEVQKCYDHMLSVGKNLGFQIYNADNYGGHIEYSDNGANSKDVLGVSAHLDIVPEGDGWIHPPFDGFVDEEGYIYGRGTQDDKGPLVACLYAMRAVADYLEENNKKPKRKIRLILGLDEETDKIGMKYYLEKAGEPSIGFTPDGDFPVINGEKGTMIFDLVRRLTKQSQKDGLRLTKLEGGNASNAVPDFAKAVASGSTKDYEKIKQKAEKYNENHDKKIVCKRVGSSLSIEAEGVASHGASPEKGFNAISLLMDFLQNIDFVNEEINDFVNFYNDRIGFTLNGENIGVMYEDEESGSTVWNTGIAKIDQDTASVTVNMRFPVTDNSDRILDSLQKELSGTSVGVFIKRIDNPIYMPKDSILVQNLLSAYRSATGDEASEPIVIPAGTYAKHIPNTLCFGALFPGEEDTMHNANERMSLDSFYRFAEIYARAIYALACE